MAFGFFKKIAKVASGGVHLLTKIPGISAVAMIVPGGTLALTAAGAADKVLSAVNAPKGSPKQKAGAAAVKVTAALAAKGDVGAANGLTVLGKRAAALRVAREFRVHPRTGVVRRAGPGAPVGKGPALKP